jgi:hypothetical protein
MACVLSLLDERVPRLALISAEPGTGKSTFLRSLAREATRRDWCVVGGTDALTLSLGPVDTASRFAESVVRGLEGTVDSMRRSAVASPRGAVLASDSSSGDRAAVELQKDILDALATHAPVLIAIDGYRPSPGCARWVGDLLRAIRARAVPVVVVIAGEPSTLDERLGRPDLTLGLGQLQPEALREHLQSVAADLAPPLEAKELELYSAAAASRPELVPPLTRLLGAASAEGDDEGALVGAS